MSTSNKIIAIDGPAGSGKSTVAKILAKRLGFLYIDTGAMYRAVTIKSINKKINPSDTNKIIKLAKNSEINLKNTAKGDLKIFLDKKDVSRAIRNPKVTSIVSDIAKISGVRRVMVSLQRKLGKNNNVVLEGRDIGTVVFPRAFKKFYLDADFAKRVKRRYKDFKVMGKNVTISQTAGDLKNRDTIDSTRKVAPLKKAKDAIYIDTTDLSINEVVDKLILYING